MASHSGSHARAETGPSASASQPKIASLHDLARQELEPLIDEEAWHNQCPPDFLQRVLATQYQFPSSVGAAGQPRAGPSSNTSSIEMQVSVQSPASTRSNCLLEEVETGALRDATYPGTQGRIPCCFDFLACSFSSSDFEEWNTHCQSHFRGRLPSTVQCPFQCDWKVSRISGYEAWEARTIHITKDHRGVGVIDTKRPPDSALIQHLWKEDIIDNPQMKELRTHGRLTGNQVFLSSYGPVRERRNDRRNR
ncbi:hypothetical protein LTR37_002949 [Vermiconidia calcicola]|uniref:Uncharacterized protein n=1 Tax=Vermiconidia calcicola TaxID=1690605 RepID=A0ACC3NRN6_9PEZI|nr:hypothetical protein LTR37_002949 [Vermiconidia calcicola]